MVAYCLPQRYLTSARRLVRGCTGFTSLPRSDIGARVERSSWFGLLTPLTGRNAMGNVLSEIAASGIAVVEPDAKALAAAKLMRERDLGAALVVPKLDPEVFAAADIISIYLVTVRPEMVAMQTLEVMKVNGPRCLVVTAPEGRMLGIVTIEVLLAALLRDIATSFFGVRSRQGPGTRSAVLMFR